MRSSALLAVMVAATFSTAAMARDTVVNVSLSEVLELPEAKGQLDGTVKFFLAGQTTPAVQTRMGEDVSNKKTNGANKDDSTACKWAALSALVAFQAGAKRNGANAVVDLVSYFKKNEVKNATTIECHAGGIIVGVALKGTYAKI